jgi:hypothetical protein
MTIAIIAPPSSRRVRRPRLVWAACSSVPSGGVPRISVACGTAITAVSACCEQVPADRNACPHVSTRLDPNARERVSDSATVSGGLAVDGDQRSVGGSRTGRADLRLLAAPDHGADRDAPVAAAADDVGPASASPERVRRLRIAPPLQLELGLAREESRAAVVWADLPEPTRQAVLVVLARLISAGAIDEESS